MTTEPLYVAFYAGWPKGWAAFNLAKEVWETGEGDLSYENEAMRAHAKEMVFPIGAPNDGFAQYFTGKSFLAPISTNQVGIFNVTFEPGCRNNWHIHHATEVEGGQIQGYKDDGLTIFKGIPFAAPPVGELRWKAPQPVVPWDTVLLATHYAAGPIQGAPSDNFSEDCLYLNVWTPAKTADENITRDYGDYMEYCEKHNIPNHFIDAEFEYIKEVYSECQKENKFI